ncbi:unnamed protein product [Closterium sp. Yama58-4]|nr:unnamed protein product [Closterium sp. Yama58-4]
MGSPQGYGGRSPGGRSESSSESDESDGGSDNADAISGSEGGSSVGSDSGGDGESESSGSEGGSYIGVDDGPSSPACSMVLHSDDDEDGEEGVEDGGEEGGEECGQEGGKEGGEGDEKEVREEGGKEGAEEEAEETRGKRDGEESRSEGREGVQGEEGGEQGGGGEGAVTPLIPAPTTSVGSSISQPPTQSINPTPQLHLLSRPATAVTRQPSAARSFLQGLSASRPQQGVGMSGEANHGPSPPRPATAVTRQPSAARSFLQELSASASRPQGVGMTAETTEDPSSPSRPATAVTRQPSAARSFLQELSASRPQGVGMGASRGGGRGNGANVVNVTADASGVERGGGGAVSSEPPEGGQYRGGRRRSLGPQPSASILGPNAEADFRPAVAHWQQQQQQQQQHSRGHLVRAHSTAAPHASRAAAASAYGMHGEQQQHPQVQLVRAHSTAAPHANRAAEAASAADVYRHEHHSPSHLVRAHSTAAPHASRAAAASSSDVYRQHHLSSSHLVRAHSTAAPRASSAAVAARAAGMPLEHVPRVPFLPHMRPAPLRSSSMSLMGESIEGMDGDKQLDGERLFIQRMRSGGMVGGVRAEGMGGGMEGAGRGGRGGRGERGGRGGRGWREGRGGIGDGRMMRPVTAGGSMNVLRHGMNGSGDIPVGGGASMGGGAGMGSREGARRMVPMHQVHMNRMGMRRCGSLNMSADVDAPYWASHADDLDGFQEELDADVDGTRDGGTEDGWGGGAESAAWNHGPAYVSMPHRPYSSGGAPMGVARRGHMGAAPMSIGGSDVPMGGYAMMMNGRDMGMDMAKVGLHIHMSMSIAPQVSQYASGMAGCCDDEDEDECGSDWARSGEPASRRYTRGLERSSSSVAFLPSD